MASSELPPKLYKENKFGVERKREQTKVVNCKIKRKEKMLNVQEDLSFDIALKDISHLSFTLPYHNSLIFAYPFYPFFHLAIHPLTTLQAHKNL